MSGIPGTVTGPNLPGGPEPASSAGDTFHPREARRCYLALPAEPAAVPYARQCTRRTLAAWDLGPVTADAELVVSELITNAEQATPRTPHAAHVVLYLAADPGRLTLLVWDACPELPARRPHDGDSAGGRGLEIVHAYSTRWGTWAPVLGGKVVWLFRAPRGTSLTAQAPGELTAQMDQVEQAAAQRTPGRSRDAGNAN
jgi:anti-sigma regulatory factor (Ser/Thr protein kinase)